jgi:hypothetical protein
MVDSNADSLNTTSVLENSSRRLSENRKPTAKKRILAHCSDQNRSIQHRMRLLRSFNQEQKDKAECSSYFMHAPKAIFYSIASVVKVVHANL